MKLLKRGAIALALAAGFGYASVSTAQEKLETLKQFRVATTDLNIPTVPQDGKKAANIRENLKRVKLPPGFKIDLFCDCSRRKAYGSCAEHKYAVCWHPQDDCMGCYRSGQ